MGFTAAEAAGLRGNEEATVRSPLRTGRTLDLYEAIPTEHHHERAVQELRDVLAA
ncbi:hypothetical protein ABZT48_32310 [Streptomyces avermitilis]|uniref:hypothetical protein n=1 Tax=Streptomyces avermitilis TaxID=33903 RepID=UPI0033AAEEF8